MIYRANTLIPPLNTLQPDGWGGYEDDGAIPGLGTSMQFDDRGYMVAGFPYKYHDFGPGSVSCGCVYVLSLEDRSAVQVIYPENAADQIYWAGFGRAIAVSGTWLVIGCAGDGSAPGTVYFYEWTGSAYTYRQRLTGTGTTSANNFGCSVAISGSLCCVGDDWADYTASNAGCVYTFRLAAGTWTEDTFSRTDAPTAQSSQRFGSVCAIDGAYLVVGAPQFDDGYVDKGRAYVFEDGGLGNPFILRQIVTPNAAAAAGECYFGESIDIGGDYCAIGWRTYDTAVENAGGRIEVFKRSGTSWLFHQGLESPTPDGNGSGGILGGERWGRTQGSVSMAGEYLLGGAPAWYHHNSSPSGVWGCAFLWKRNATTDVYEVIEPEMGYGSAIYFMVSAEFGNADAIGADGRFAVGAPSESGTWDPAGSQWALPELDPPWTAGGTIRYFLPGTVVAPKISTEGGELITLTVPLTVGNYLVYIDGESCYGGETGGGYQCVSDGATMDIVTPILSTAGELVVEVRDTSDVLVAVGKIIVVPRTQSDTLYHLRTRWPDWYQVGARDISQETE